jgi:FMN-dependent NADH-azoreductase
MPISYEKIKARKAIDPEYAAKQKSYAVAYKERNKDKELERQRLVKAKVREKDRDSYNAKMREWTEKNKERLNKKRREKLRRSRNWIKQNRLISLIKMLQFRIPNYNQI